jgi:hypothetical protein
MCDQIDPKQQVDGRANENFRPTLASFRSARGWGDTKRGAPVAEFDVENPMRDAAERTDGVSNPTREVLNTTRGV